MRSIAKLMQDWQFTGPDGKTTLVELPHTWNAKDGQDGGNDYWRGTCTYSTTFAAPAFDAASQEVWLQFEGVNSSAKVLLNGKNICTHDGGYSTFRVHVSDLLEKDNQLTVEVDNSINDRIYPQKADFTFYGGIYRDISLMVVSKNHIALGHFGDTGVKITPALKDGRADIRVETIVEGEGAVSVELQDAAGSIVARAEGADAQLHLDAPHLWDGVKDPYLYTCVVRLSSDGTVVDEVSTRVGLRTFSVDSRNGFFLNGRPYPLHGVSRHQDRKGVGNAITREMHDEDMALIRELGANTVRLAHYQHDQYFYDLCDQYGMVVWAEIPYISEHLPNGRANTISQMKELIYQNYNHPCIVVWTPLNESWGVQEIETDPRQQAHSEAMVAITKSMDTTRLVVDNDGWEHTNGDLLTIHDYSPSGEMLRAHLGSMDAILALRPAQRALFVGRHAYAGQPILLSEFGGVKFVPGTEAQHSWGYCEADSCAAFAGKLRELFDAVRACPLVDGYCYTQLTDVETEQNGLLTYDRTPKLPLETICAILNGRTNEHENL